MFLGYTDIQTNKNRIDPMNHIVTHITQFLQQIDEHQYWKFLLMNQWAEIMGPLASKVTIQKMYQTTIILGVNDSSWMQELHLLSELIKEKINKTLKNQKITTIKLRYTTPTKPKIIKKKITVPTVKSVYILTNKEQQALQKIHDPELAQALQGFLQQCHQFC